MVAIRGGYRMARGWHYAKLSLSSAIRLSFSGMCILLLLLFLSLCRFLFVFFFFCSHWSLVYVPSIFFCPADHVPDWQPRILLSMVEARSVNVKKTITPRPPPPSPPLPPPPQKNQATLLFTQTYQSKYQEEGWYLQTLNTLA